MSGACESQLNSALFDRLSSKTYHVAFVDLMFNECGLALADKLGAPAVGFGFSLTSGPQEFSTLDTLPSYVPVLLSHLPDKMTFLQRTYNLLVKASSRLYMYFSAGTSTCQSINFKALTCLSNSTKITTNIETAMQ